LGQETGTRELGFWKIQTVERLVIRKQGVREGNYYFREIRISLDGDLRLGKGGRDRHRCMLLTGEVQTKNRTKLREVKRNGGRRQQFLQKELWEGRTLRHSRGTLGRVQSERAEIVLRHRQRGSAKPEGVARLDRVRREGRNEGGGNWERGGCKAAPFEKGGRANKTKCLQKGRRGLRRQ